MQAQVTNLEDRLTAWGEWGRRRRRRAQRETGSAEGGWRSGDRGDTAPTNAPIINARDCQEIEFAWSGLTVLRNKAFLWMHYRQQYAQRRILFILADMPGPLLYPHDWGLVWDAAHLAIETALARQRNTPIVLQEMDIVDIFPVTA